MLLIAFECCFLSLLKTSYGYQRLAMLYILNASVDYFSRTERESYASLICEVRRCWTFPNDVTHKKNQCLCPFFHIRWFPKLPDLVRKRLILPQACYYPSINSKCYSFSPSKRCFIKWCFPFFWKLLILFNLSKDVRCISSFSKWTRPITKLRSSADLKLSLVISFPKDVTRLLTDDYF